MGAGATAAAGADARRSAAPARARASPRGAPSEPPRRRYARYSTSAQKATSIEDQLRNVRKLVEAEGDALPDELVFVDKAVSGTTEAGRDRFRRLKETIFRRPPPVSALVVDDLSRLGRNMSEVLTF